MFEVEELAVEIPDEVEETGFDPVPAGLDEMPPGPVLAAFLASIDVERVSGHDRVTVLRARHRLAAHYQAEAYQAMAAVADAMHATDPDFESAERSAAAEIGLALRLTRRAADLDLGLAYDLWRRHPQVGEAFAAGNLDLRRVRVLIAGVAHLPDPDAAHILDQVLAQAPRLTTGQLGARIRRLCLHTHPDAAADRYHQALAERRVVTEATDAGTVNLLGLDLAPDQAAQISHRIDTLAHSLRRDGETRTIDQLRADVLVDLLLGITRPDQQPGGSIELRVDLTTLTELTQHPGELAGYGPVIADLTRQLAHRLRDCEWRYVITHPDTGLPLHLGTTRRRPTTTQTRHIRARYPTCVFPGCRRPATHCDLDHTTPWTESHTTCTCNLAPLCAHHHTTRHLPGWTYHRLDHGDHQWTTPLGHTYTTSGQSP